MLSRNDDQKPTRLLASVPSEDRGRMIVRYPTQTDSELAYAYHFAAQRLASTFKGHAEDDLLLLPFLFLYRQAFELQLKSTIRFLVGLRIRYVGGDTRKLLDAASAERLAKDLGHNLHRLLNQAKNHFEALSLANSFPRSVEEVILMLHEADNAGTAFRYAGLLPDTQEDADFPHLVKKLDTTFTELCDVVDYAEGMTDACPDANELI